MLIEPYRVEPKIQAFKFFIVGMIFSMSLSAIFLHKVLFSEGLIESIDIGIQAEIGMHRSAYFQMWNYQAGGDNAPLVAIAIPHLLSLLSDSSSTVQKLTLFVVFTSIGTSIFTVIALLTRRIYSNRSITYLAAIVGTTVFLVNPWVAVRTFHLYYLWSYAFVPLIFFLSLSLNKEKSLKSSVRIAIVLGLLLGLTQFRPFLLSILLVIYVISIQGLFVRSGNLRNLTTALAITLLTAFFFSSYWVLPYASFFAEQYKGGGIWSPSTSDLLSIWSINAETLNAITMTSNASWGSLFNPQGALKDIWLTLRTVIPIYAFAAVIMRKDKNVLTVVILAVATIFLAKGANEPFGDFFLWLILEAPFSSHYGWLFKDPYAFTMFLSLCYAFLSSISTAEIFKRLQKPTDENKK